jgi:F420-dependent oxidoreductase-like protein
VDLRIFTEPHQGATYGQLFAVAKMTQDCGYDAFFRSDHYLRMGPGDPRPGPTDAWTTLAGLALQTREIRLGTLVSPVTFRLPSVLAVQIGQVDVMSGGRVELGLGTGWNEAEHAAFGLPFPPVGERFDRLEEQLEILTGLWSTDADKSFSYSGRYYSVDMPALPRPAQERVPLILGGGGPRRTPALAARFATEFNTGFVAVEEVRTRFERVRAACADARRDPSDLTYSVALSTVCGEDDQQVSERATATGQDVATLRTTGVVGTPSEIVDRLGAYASVGATRVYLQIWDLDDLDMLQLIADRVMPQLP